MADLDLVDSTPTSPSRATDLIADFQARHDAWRRQGENLVRLRADARAAAAREAAAIHATARAEIHRIVREARRRLSELTAQLQALDAQTGESYEPQEPDSVLQARRDLQRLLADIGPELDQIGAEVRQFDDPTSPSQVDPTVISVPELDEVEHEAALAAIAPLFELDEPVKSPDPTPVVPASLPTPSAPAPSVSGATGPAPTVQATTVPRATVPTAVPAQPASADRGKATWDKTGIVTVLAVVAAAVVSAGGWWVSGFVGAKSLAPPLTAIPRVPNVTPSWLDDRTPTLSATLIALPPSTTPAALSVEIELRREAWVQAAIDSDAPTSRIFRAGESVRLQGERGISISTRDGGAVLASVNGGPRIPLGPDGREVAKQFRASDREIASR